MIPFNINNHVSVRLTPHGRSILAAQDAELLAEAPHLKQIDPPKEDACGWSRWQLWDLMQRLGAHCYNGCEIPFETEIRIEE